MLTAKQKAAWLEALRSGEYRRGTGSLRADDMVVADDGQKMVPGRTRHCCLGVLAEIVGPELGWTWTRVNQCGWALRVHRSGDVYGNNGAYLPESFGLGDDNTGSVQFRLADLNDDAGEDSDAFPAAVIEAIEALPVEG